MSAVVKPSYDTQRRRLADSLPLSAPFTVFIEPTRYCNLKCFFCMHGTRGNSDGALARAGLEVKHMDFELYKSLMRQLAEFPEPPIRIVYSGLGEPLMNLRLSEMIAFAKDMNIFKRLDILTNATLLTHELSDSLTASGVSRIQVSLEGLDSKKYKEVTGVNIDFEKLRENLDYLYTHKGKSSVFIKIIDALLETQEQKDLFYKLFGGICDQIFIEHLITLQQPMGNPKGLADNTRNLNNEEVVPRDVCPVVFYQLQIDVDGNVFPCPVSGLPASFAMGNIKEETLVEIWNGRKRNKLICSHLRHERSRVPICNTCHATSCILDENENLDDDTGKLLQFFDIDKEVKNAI
ncbi:MAG: radical SAM protein [Lentisphaerae bacterium GWF2_45_14]|nr:MAG: radical SAM protein [Lentisphaerae bacterium GWF2_45_14]